MWSHEVSLRNFVKIFFWQVSLNNLTQILNSTRSPASGQCFIQCFAQEKNCQNISSLLEWRILHRIQLFQYHLLCRKCMEFKICASCWMCLLLGWYFNSKSQKNNSWWHLYWVKYAQKSHAFTKGRLLEYGSVAFRLADCDYNRNSVNKFADILQASWRALTDATRHVWWQQWCHSRLQVYGRQSGPFCYFVRMSVCRLNKGSLSDLLDPRRCLHVGAVWLLGVARNVFRLYRLRAVL